MVGKKKTGSWGEKIEQERKTGRLSRAGPSKALKVAVGV
jgi:hypothetical protein